MTDLVLRPMRLDDLDQIVELENDLFSEPWPRCIFIREIGDRERSWTVVSEEEGIIVCYAVAWYVEREFHIANFAVRRECQRRGVGGRLIDLALDEARKSGCRLATLEVRVSNETAIRLYESRDFRAIAIRKGYYADNGEDAIIMIRDLAQERGESNGLVQ